MNPIVLASKAKGPFAFVKRIRNISGRYSLTSSLMDQALRLFSNVLQRFDCGATFPITAVTLQRHSTTIKKYLGQNIEFAVHGYTHVDYAQLAPETQLIHLKHAREIFTKAGIIPMGFRSPYLSRNDHLYAAIQAAGYSYVSNQPILWEVLDADAFTPPMHSGYERALAFYDSWLASERLSLPHGNRHLVEIPISLPDDEILIERLGGGNSLVRETWLRILSQSYQRGELFTLQLHPERISLCADSLSAVLAKARALTPAVWCTSLSEIAAWWKARTRTIIGITDAEEGSFQIRVTAPMETTILAYNVQVDAPTVPWAGGFQQVKAKSFSVHSNYRPFIGLSASTSSALASFLCEQGYIFERNEDRRNYLHYIDMPEFLPEHERSLLAQIDEADYPLVRLGRWPNGAKSALAITGDIDAITLWDFGLRLIGR